MCNEIFEIEDLCVKHTQWGIEYVDKITLMDDNRCDKLCDKISQKVCNILIAYDLIEIKREELRLKMIQNRIDARKVKTDKLDDDGIEINDLLLVLQKSINKKKKGFDDNSGNYDLVEERDNGTNLESESESEDEVDSNIVYIFSKDKIDTRIKQKKKGELWEQKYNKTGIKKVV